jgi:hypothetical protein
MDAYAALVILHSWLRWVVLLTALLAVIRGVSGRMGRRAWAPADAAAGRWFTISLDVQVLIGLILYVFLSPYTMSAWSNMPDAMRDSVARYWAVEHLAGMLVATALAHVGRARARKLSDPSRQHLQAAIFFGLALVVMLASIPWPGMAAGRPLFRGL